MTRHAASARRYRHERADYFGAQRFGDWRAAVSRAAPCHHDGRATRRRSRCRQAALARRLDRLPPSAFSKRDARLEPAMRYVRRLYDAAWLAPHYDTGEYSAALPTTLPMISPLPLARRTSHAVRRMG